jgi:F-type H+-transporting ATPase subunit b
MWFLLAQEGHGVGPEIDPTHLTEHANLAAAIWAWCIFLVLVVLMWKFAWGPISKGLDARALRITESLKRAEEVEKAAREIAETNRQILLKAQHDAQQLVADARNIAQQAAEEVRKKATAEVDAQRERFTRETQLAVEKARDDLRRDTVELTIAATARLLGRSLSDADSRRLAAEALADAETVARN